MMQSFNTLTPLITSGQWGNWLAWVHLNGGFKIVCADAGIVQQLALGSFSAIAGLLVDN